MTLDDIGLYSQPTKAPQPHKPLHTQVRCVCALIRRYLPRLKNEQAWKINVYVCGDDNDQQVNTHNGITSVNLKREVGEFFSMDDSDKRRFAYEALREGAEIVSDHHGWRTQEILEAFDKAMQVDLINEWEFQPKWSSSRKYRAYVKCSHEIDRFRAWMRVEDRDGLLVAEQFLFDEVPDEFCFHQRLGRVRWTDNKTVRLIDRAGEVVADDVHLKIEQESTILMAAFGASRK